MLAFISLLLAGVLSGLVAANTNCPGHGKVYQALTHYASSAKFCSTQLGITPVSITVSTTSTSTTTTTTTVKSGTTLTTAPAVTSKATVLFTTSTTVTSTTTITLSKPASTSTITTTITKTTAKIAACAASSAITTAKAKVKRAATTTSQSRSTPTELTGFSDATLSAGCSCLRLTTATVTVTASVRATSIVIKRTTTLAGTGITTPTSKVTRTSTVVSTISSTTTATTTTGSTTTFTSTTTTTVAYSTPSSFFIKGSNGLYVSLANLTGGAMYLDSSSSKGADTFKLNSANQLVVTTDNSQYEGYLAVGTPATTDATTDWYQMEVTDDGTDYDRQALCCSITNSGTLTCNYGELFGLCSDGALYEGSQEAPEYDYYYTALECTAVKLTAVAK